MTATLTTHFDAFLFASIAEDANGMPLTLLSVLARLGVDPWEEAADLARLAPEPATQRLVLRLEKVLNGPAPGPETVTLATRLIALLHRSPAPKVRSPEAPSPPQVAKGPKQTNLAIYYLARLILMLFAQWAMSSRHTQAPMDTSITPDSRR